MDIQKIAYCCFKLIEIILFSLIGMGCTSTVVPHPPVEQERDQEIADKLPSIVENCLEEIHIEVGDSILLYWVEIAQNDKHLVEHAGNYRNVITQDGTFYHSRNRGAIQNFDSYFNTPLIVYKRLSAQELQTIKEVVEQMGLEKQPSYIENSKMRYLGGYEAYFYYKSNERFFCKKMDMNVDVYTKINALLSV